MMCQVEFEARVRVVEAAKTGSRFWAVARLLLAMVVVAGPLPAT